MVWFLVPLYFKAQVNPLMSNTFFLLFNFKEKITVAEKRNNYQFRGRTCLKCNVKYYKEKRLYSLIPTCSLYYLTAPWPFSSRQRPRLDFRRSLVSCPRPSPRSAFGGGARAPFPNSGWWSSLPAATQTINPILVAFTALFLYRLRDVSSNSYSVRSRTQTKKVFRAWL